MGAEPVWFLYQIKPEDALRVKNVFNKAVEQSQISENLRGYLQNRTREPDKYHQQDDIFSFLIPKPFVDSYQNPDVFDWEDSLDTIDLFYPKAFVEMCESLLRGEHPFEFNLWEEVELEWISINRASPTQALWAGLGWKRASRLPGYLGNIFVLPENVASVLATIEEIFKEVIDEDFLYRAMGIGDNKSVAERLLTLLPSAFRTVSKEGNGCLALSYPHLGSIPFPGCEEYEDDY
jgi:hypothetical protein